MTIFDEREKDFEARYRHDQELQFKVKARRNKLLGLNCSTSKRSPIAAKNCATPCA